MRIKPLHTSSIKSKTKIDSTWIDVISPEKIQTLFNFCEVSVGQCHSSNVWIVTILGAMKVVSHDIKHVNDRIN